MTTLHFPARWFARSALSALAFAPLMAAAAPQFGASFLPLPPPFPSPDPVIVLPGMSMQPSLVNTRGDGAGNFTPLSRMEVYEAGQFDPARKDLAGYRFVSSQRDDATGSTWVTYLGASNDAFVVRGGQVSWIGANGFGESEARFINERGQVAGNLYDRHVAVSYDSQGWRKADPQAAGFAEDRVRSHAFVYDNGVMTDLGTLGGSRSFVNALNNRGDVLGMSSLAGDSSAQAFIYSSGKMTALGTPGQSSYASLLNEQGMVAGQSGNDTFIYRDGVFTNLGAMGGEVAYADKLTEQGVVAGSVYGRRDREDKEIFVYKDGFTSYVPALQGADGQELDMFMTAINDRGDVAGFAASFDYTDRRAFVFMDGQIIDLSEQLKSIDGAQSINLLWPVSIDNDRRILFSGLTSNLLLTPTTAVPEASTAFYLLLGIVIMFIGARSRRHTRASATQLP